MPYFFFFMYIKESVLRIRFSVLWRIYLLLFSDFYPGPTATQLSTHLYPSNRAWRSHRQRKFKSRGRDPKGRGETDRKSPWWPWFYPRDVTNYEASTWRERRPREFSQISDFSILRHRRTRATSQVMHLDNVIEMLRRFRHDVTRHASCGSISAS